MIPKLSMNPAAHYKVQTSAYDRLLIGKPLSDRRITALQKLGYFGTGFLSVQRKEKAKRQKRELRLSDFI